MALTSITSLLAVAGVWLGLSLAALLLVAAMCRSGHLEDEHRAAHPPGV